MTSATKKVIQKTLKHYDEMIEWAKGQKARGWVNERKMYREISQSWYAGSCPLCAKFFHLNLDLNDDKTPCNKCPIYAKYGGCDYSPNSPWKLMNFSSTWKTWIRHATAMREQIASLLEEKSKEERNV